MVFVRNDRVTVANLLGYFTHTLKYARKGKILIEHGDLVSLGADHVITSCRGAGDARGLTPLIHSTFSSLFFSPKLPFSRPSSRYVYLKNIVREKVGMFRSSLEHVVFGARLLQIARCKCQRQQFAQLVQPPLVLRIDEVHVEVEIELGHGLPARAARARKARLHVAEKEMRASDTSSAFATHEVMAIALKL